MHKIVNVSLAEITKEEFKKDLLEKFGNGVVLLDTEHDPITEYTDFTFLVENRHLVGCHKLFGSRTLPQWLTECETELRLVPQLMSWYDDEDVVFNMNVWLHEPSNIAFVDQKGTIRVLDLNIEIPAEIEKEEFSPRP